MTCIVGIETKNGVMIGGDSCASTSRQKQQSRLSKVFKNDKFLIGYTSSFRMGQLLQYSLFLENQTSHQSDLEYLSTNFISAVRECFKQNGFMTFSDQQEVGGEFLLGYNGKLYCVYNDFQVNSMNSGYMATGCGEEYALGSLHSTTHLSSEKRIIKALDAAANFSIGVAKPYIILNEKD